MKAFSTLLAFLLALATSLAAPAADLPSIPYEKYQLPNGLEVILVENHRLPLVAVNIWYHVGPANEEPGRTGFAHLFEHMMFEGSKHIPRGASEKLAEAAGVTDANGSTDFDRTNYYDTWPSNQLELALWTHSDRMGYLLDVLDQKSLSNQQDVVRNERRQSFENRPYGIVEEALYHNLFPKTHPYYASVIGSHADIQAAQLADIRKFFKLYYTPNNASLVIAGAISKHDVKQLVARYFGTLKRGPDAPPIKVETPPIASERRAVVQDRIELQRVYMGWITSPAYQPGDAELDAASQVLAGGKSSRLYQKLVYELQIAQEVEAYQYSLRLGSVFQLTATARPGRTAQELEAAIDAELDRFRREGMTGKELERAANKLETALIKGFDKLGGDGIADRMNRYNHYLGDPGYLPKDIERYRKLTAEGVRKVVEAQLRKDARVVIHAVPGKQDLGPEVPTPPPPQETAGTVTEAINPDAPWRKKQPKAGPAAAFRLPVPRSFKLANGLTVIHHERPGLPIVSASLVVKSGSEANPIARPGLASYTADMLDEGTTTRSATRLADDVAQLGTTLEAGSSGDFSQVSLDVLAKNAGAALDIVADVVLRPAFAPEEIERQRASRLASLVQVRDDPNALVGRIAAAAIFGDKHPYGHLDLGNEESVKAIARDDLQAFWKRHFVPGNAALVVAGNIGAAELKALAGKSFGSWQPGQRPEVTPPQPASTSARVVLVHKPDTPQTALRVAQLGPPRLTPDYPQIAVMNAALGGNYTSRIYHNLREEKGYTYGTYSVFRFRRSTGFFEVRGSIRTDVTAPAVSEILKEVRGMREQPVTREEWLRARDSQVRSLPGAFETSADTAKAFANVFTYDLGLDYYSKLPARFNAVTPAQMQAAARKYLSPESLIVVAVGDRAKIEDGLVKLGLGAVEHRDAEARVVK